MEFRRFNKPRKYITGYDLFGSDTFFINRGTNRISQFFDEATLKNHESPTEKIDFDNTKNIQNRDQRMAIARRRIADDYYNSLENMDNLAEILIEKLDFN